MLVLRDMARSIARNRGRSLLTACIALFLMLCMGLYLGTIEENRSALANLSESLPVTVKIVNGDGSAEVGLGITGKMAEKLMESGIREPVYTAQIGGNLEEVNRKNADKISDTGITGANSLDAFGEDIRESIDLLEGWDGDFIAGDEAVCLVDSAYAQRHGVQAGGTVELPVQWLDYDKSGVSFQYRPLADVRLKIIGTFRDNGEYTSMIVPIAWMQRLFEEQGVAFTYDSFRCVVADALRLNDFKLAAVEAGFHEVRSQVANPHTGNALAVQDKVFIESARRLQNNIGLFLLFRLPFFLLLTGLVVLATFLTCRGRQVELAIEASLGKPRALSGLGMFLENILLYLMGLAAAGVVLWLTMALHWGQLFTIALAFLGCAAAGVLVSVCLLIRFDPLALLTHLE